MKLIASIGGALLFFSGIAQASILQFSTTLSGPAEAPPNESPGTGEALVIYDAEARTMRLIVSFADLIAPVTAAHIHATTAEPFAGTAGVAVHPPSLEGFPLGVTEGNYDHTFDLTSLASYNPSFVTANLGTAAGAEAALISALAGGRAYLNIHSTQFPGGEIRGFFTPVPDVSATGSLLALALLAMFGCGRFRRFQRE